MSTKLRLSRVLVGSAVIMLTGCQLSIPADPDGTLEQVRGGSIRVGVSLNEPWTASEEDGSLTGSEVALVEKFAQQLNADVEWKTGGEEHLVGALERGELDLVIGGVTEKSPWIDKVAMTHPYDESPAPDGSVHKHVMLTPMGENAFLVELEEFLLTKEEQR